MLKPPYIIYMALLDKFLQITTNFFTRNEKKILHRFLTPRNIVLLYLYFHCFCQRCKQSRHLRIAKYFLHLIPNIAAIDRHSKSSRHYQVVIGILTAKYLLYLVLFLLYINKTLCNKLWNIDFAFTGISLSGFEMEC